MVKKKTEPIEPTVLPPIIEVTPNEAIAVMPPEVLIAKLVQESNLTIQMHAPDEGTLTLLKDENALQTAQEFTIKSDADYALANTAWTALKDEAERLETTRTEGTKPLNKLKTAWDFLFKNNRLAAVTVYQSKMRAYENQKKQEDASRKTEQERLAKEAQEQLRKDAEALEKKAAGLSSPKRKAELLQEAEGLKTAALNIPDSFAQSTSVMPTLGGGGRAKVWGGEVTNPKAFMKWMVDNDREEIAGVEFKTSMLNNLAKLITDTRTIPGFKAEDRTSYRRDARRDK